jgi:hypothetical protein
VTNALTTTPLCSSIEVGAVWYKQRVEVNSFEVTFTVRISNLSHSSGHADGFAFVVQNHRGTPPLNWCDVYVLSNLCLSSVNAFGAGDGGIGYGTIPDYDDLGVRKSVAVEFDTFRVRCQL